MDWLISEEHQGIGRRKGANDGLKPVYSLYALRSYYPEALSIGLWTPATSTAKDEKSPFCVGIQY